MGLDRLSPRAGLLWPKHYSSRLTHEERSRADRTVALHVKEGRLGASGWGAPGRPRWDHASSGLGPPLASALGHHDWSLFTALMEGS